jgi:hypothetical protein
LLSHFQFPTSLQWCSQYPRFQCRGWRRALAEVELLTDARTRSSRQRTRWLRPKLRQTCQTLLPHWQLACPTELEVWVNDVSNEIGQMQINFSESFKNLHYNKVIFKISRHNFNKYHAMSFYIYIMFFSCRWPGRNSLPNLNLNTLKKGDLNLYYYFDVICTYKVTFYYCH